MRTHALTIFMCLFLCLCGLMQAQNPNPDWADVEFPNLIFTEYRGDRQQTNYVEITNTEDFAIDLSSFRLVAGHFREYDEFTPNERWYSKNWLGEVALTGTLQPGESMVFAHAFDKAISSTDLTPKANYELIEKTTWPIFKEDDLNPEIPFINDPEHLAFDFDSVGSDSEENYLLHPAGGKCAYGLWFKYEHADSIGAMVTDSLMVDVINLWMTDTESKVAGYSSNVAGIIEATTTHTLVRKFNSPPLADWDISRGISSGDSHWMPVTNAAGLSMYTTLGNHGDYTISLEAKAGTAATVDNDNHVITMPWEAVRGDSARVNYLEFGDGMAWEYIKDSIDIADSAYMRVREGDLLNVYAFGTELRSQTYTFKVSDATADLAIARSKVGKYADGYYNRVTPYLDITSGEPVMDSIVNIRYQMRIDTLLTYAEIPPLATAEVIYVDNDASRIDLVDGDILRVTSENGQVVKDYYLQVDEYYQNDYTTLGSITWPDYNTDDFFEWEYLQHDTLPEFVSGIYNYKLTLPENYVNVPALFATTTDLNSKLVIKRAINLTGSAEERTTTFTVTSESDTLESVYSVIFELDLGAGMQLTQADPFISENIGLRITTDEYIEIYNPNNGTEPLDMSRYLIVLSSVTADAQTAITSALSTDPVAVDAHKSYVPGYKFNYNKGGSEDNSTWTWKDGIVGGITADANVNAFVAPGDVFVIGNWDVTNTNQSNMSGVPTAEVADVNLQGNPDFPNMTTSAGVTHFTWNCAYYLYEIINDSILNGTKGIWDSSDDYRHIDVVSLKDIENVAGHKFYPQALQFRKPRVQTGSLISGEGGAFHADVDTSDFYHWSRRATAPQEWKLTGATMGQFLGYHDMDAITFHMSTVTSNAYKVDLGYEGDLSIKGEMTNVTVADFLSNLNKPDTLQTLTVKRGDVVQADDAIVATGDIVVVLSADSINTTEYTIEASALSNDVSLTSVGDLGIVVGNLTLSGFSYDKVIADVLAGVECNDLSVINVVDADDNLVPLITRSADTSLIEPLVATNVFNGVYFEVVAEDGTTAKYALTADATASEAYLTSNVFTVSQEDPKNISGVSGGYAVSTFLSYLNASGNATLEIKNKVGAPRIDGMLQIDDYVAVTSEDGSKVVNYAINFFGENTPDSAPSKLVQQEAKSLVKVYPNPTSSLLNIENAVAGSIVQIISLNGSMMYSNVVNNDNCAIDMSPFNNGVYIVRLVSKDATTVVRVLKK